ncbi:uncharacterized protein LOC109858647 [Pseudomyrmex gracilis]|uniref:uncharacterized protein LOC109858647 n=1 Tax=Pseudomyrmex gracilis TaxID=219809 RepID=UPI0009949052|nr:uncharacterized protein LOC109858647 [Pseudomyrmex gracilis]
MSDNEGMVYEEDGDIQDEGTTEIEYLESEMQEIKPVYVKEEHNEKRYSLGERTKKTDKSLTKDTTQKNRFIPIRPKPYPSALIIKQQTGEDLSATSVPVLPHHIIVTIPSKDKTQYIFPTNVSLNKNINEKTIKLNGDTKIVPVKTRVQTNEKVIKKSCQSIATNKVVHNVNKASPVSSKDSIELFFESMAQSVLNLPQRVQANIKMKICQVVTMAEIKYSNNNKTKSRPT